MRIATFFPAVLGLSLFAASAQAGTLSKRGGERNDVDLVIPKIFVDANVKAVVQACAKLTLDACLDVNLELWADAQVLGNVVDTSVVVKNKLSVKAALDAEVKAIVKADVQVRVLALVDAHVDKLLLKLCPILSANCAREHAHDIVVDVKAFIVANLPVIRAKVVAHLDVKLRERLDIEIQKLNVNAGILNAQIHGNVHVASDIHAHLDAFVNVWAEVYVKVLIPRLTLGAI